MMTIDLINFSKFSNIISIANRGDCSGNGSYLYFDVENDRILSISEKVKIKIQAVSTKDYCNPFVAYLPEINNIVKAYSSILVSKDMSVINDGNKIKLTTYENSKTMFSNFKINESVGKEVTLSREEISYIIKAKQHTKESDNNQTYQYIYCQNGTLFSSSLGKIYSVNFAKAIGKSVPDFIIHASVASVMGAIAQATDKEVTLVLSDKGIVIKSYDDSIIVEFVGTSSVSYPPLLSEGVQSKIERVEHFSFSTEELKESIKFLMFYASDLKNNKVKLEVSGKEGKFLVEPKDVIKKVSVSVNTLNEVSFYLNLSFLKEAVDHVESDRISIYTIDDNDLERENKKPFRICINEELSEEIIIAKLLVNS